MDATWYIPDYEESYPEDLDNEEPIWFEDRFNEWKDQPAEDENGV